MCNRELKNPPPAYTEDGRFSRVTTSIHIFLTENTSAGTSYPAAITGGSCRSLAGCFFLIALLQSFYPVRYAARKAMFHKLPPGSSQRLPFRTFGTFSGKFPLMYSLCHRVLLFIFFIVPIVILFISYK